MKKLVLGITLVAVAMATHGACIDWKYTGISAQKDYTVYVVLGDTAQTTWASLSALSAAAVDVGGSATIAYKSQKYTASNSLVDDAITTTDASYYFVLVNKTETEYQVSTVIDGSSYVYDPTKQQTTPGTQNTNNAGASWTSAKAFSGTPGPSDVPEPTSGLLLLLGMAGLALKRKSV